MAKKGRPFLSDEDKRRNATMKLNNAEFEKLDKLQELYGTGRSQTIRKLIDTKKSRSLSRPVTYIDTTLFKNNMDQIPGLIRLAAAAGIDAFILHPLFNAYGVDPSWLWTDRAVALVSRSDGVDSTNRRGRHAERGHAPLFWPADAAGLWRRAGLGYGRLARFQYWPGRRSLECVVQSA